MPFVLQRILILYAFYPLFDLLRRKYTVVHGGPIGDKTFLAAWVRVVEEDVRDGRPIFSTDGMPEKI